MKRCIKITDSNEVCDKDIKSVTFVCENCEVIKIPIKNFTKLNISKVDNEYYNFECVIKKIDNIEYHSFTNDLSPFNRLSMSDDIVKIELEFKNGTIKLIRPVWEGTDFNNYCQISHVISWNEISISINEENMIKKMKQQCADKANRILNILYQDFAIDSCNNCCYKADCDNLRKNNNDITICAILDLMQK
jgi:hypothetical protein|nr:MAG TPA: hypothetical protein [Caudoviricetes sp.]